MTVEIIISQPQPNVTPITDNGFVESVEITCYSQLLEIVDNQCNVPWVQANIQFLNTIKGVGISNIEKTSTVGLVDTYTITYTDGTTDTFDVTNGIEGGDGRGIVSILKTSTQELTDTYTITYTDDTTSTFDVKNGVDGVSVESITLYETVGLVDTYEIIYSTGSRSYFNVKNGADGVGTDGRGIVSIIKTSTVGLVDTYTVTYSDSTTSTFDVTNGEKGDNGTSAYEIYIAGGGTLSEIDYNASITNIPSHIADTDIHVTTTDKANWDSKADLDEVLKLDQSTPQTIVGRQIQQDGVQLGLTPTVGTHETGKIFWDADFKTPACELEDAVTVQLGQETLVYVYNGTGLTLNQGGVVYSATTFNGVPSVALAKGDMDETSQVLGIITSTSILTGFYGYATIRGHVNNIDTSLFAVNDNLYLSAEIAGKLTNVKPNTGDYDTRVGRVMIQNATTGRVYVNIIREYKVGSVSAGSGVDMYLDDTTITPSGTLSTYPIKTLSKTPIASTEDVDSIVLNNNTAMYGVYLNTAPIGKTSIAGGTWSFDIWAGVSSATNVTSLYQLVQRVRSEAGTITTTNLTATSKTVTASTGTPFATTKIDVGGTLLTCSFLRTPSGLYRILTRVSDTVITIEVPTTYVNESTVAYSVFKTLFSVNTGEINNVATSPLFAGLQVYYIQTVQAAFTVETTDTLATAMVGTSTGARTVYFSHNGNNRYTHFHTPLSTSHNDLSGLNDGDYKHLTATQLSELASAGTTYLKLDQTTPQTLTQSPKITDLVAGQMCYVDANKQLKPIDVFWDVVNGRMGIGGSRSAKLTILDTDKGTTNLYSSSNLIICTFDTTAANIGGSLSLGGRINSTTGIFGFASLKGCKSNATINNLDGYAALFTTKNGIGSREHIRVDADGNTGIDITTPKSKLQVAGGIQCGDDTAAASADKVGTRRRRIGVDGNIGYYISEECSQKGVDEYEWTEIFRNEWIIP